MKLVIAGLRALDGYVSREFSFIIRELIDQYGWKHLEFAALRHSGKPVADALQEACGELPRVVLFWEGYDFLCAHAREVRALPCLKGIFADDIHDKTIVTRWGRIGAYLSCDIVFAAYADRFEELFPEVCRLMRVVWTPHSASPEFLLPWNPGARNAVLLSGMVNEFYPLRQAMKSLCDTGRHAIVHHPHPGYHCGYRRDDSRVGRAYAQLLNGFRTAFTDSSRFRYIVAKFFEIPAAGALLLADRNADPSLAQLGFKAGEHYVPATFKDLETQVEFVLDRSNRDALDQIRLRGQRLVWKRHTTSNRARLIDETCRM
jgi:hypothetical protein